MCDVLGISVPRLRGLLASQPAEPASDEDVERRDIGPAPLRAGARRSPAGSRRRQWLVTARRRGTAALAVGVGVALSRPEPVRAARVTCCRRPRRPRRPTRRAWCGGPTASCTSRDPSSGSPTSAAWSRRALGRRTSTRDGRLIGVTADGDRTLLGRPAEGSPLVSSPRLGLVAWADASVPDVTRLVVWDVEAQQAGGRRGHPATGAADHLRRRLAAVRPEPARLGVGPLGRAGPAHRRRLLRRPRRAHRPGRRGRPASRSSSGARSSAWSGRGVGARRCSRASVARCRPTAGWC